jgi:hypothetical protein
MCKVVAIFAAALLLVAQCCAAAEHPTGKPNLQVGFFYQ